MPVAIETVIIIIVVVSFAVFSAVIFALYWLWRLLLEDRRCTKLRRRRYLNDWRFQPLSAGSLEDGPQLLTDSGQPRIARTPHGRTVYVDERSRRMKGKKNKERSSQSVSTERPTSEVVVLDGTEPPPPYEDALR